MAALAIAGPASESRPALQSGSVLLQGFPLSQLVRTNVVRGFNPLAVYFYTVVIALDGWDEVFVVFEWQCFNVYDISASPRDGLVVVIDFH